MDPLEELDKLLDTPPKEISEKLGVSHAAGECILDAIADYLGIGDEEGGEEEEDKGDGEAEEL